MQEIYFLSNNCCNSYLVLQEIHFSVTIVIIRIWYCRKYFLKIIPHKVLFLTYSFNFNSFSFIHADKLLVLLILVYHNLFCICEIKITTVYLVYSKYLNNLYIIDYLSVLLSNKFCSNTVVFPCPILSDAKPHSLSVNRQPI